MEAASPSSGETRVFLNWARALPRSFQLSAYKCSEPIEQVVGRKWSGHDRHEQRVLLEHSDVVVADDWHGSVATELTTDLDANVVLYAQTPFGLHSLTSGRPSSLIRHKVGNLVPFRILSREYRRTLESSCGVLANSRRTSDLLRYVYGVSPYGVVYPPVDMDAFRPRGGNKERDVLVYMGSHPWDTDVVLATNLARKALEGGAVERVHFFGSRDSLNVIRSLLPSPRVEIHRGLTDEELAKLYSRCALTIAPQHDELFGYVPVESLACGTPVYTLIPHEAVEEGANGWTGWTPGRMKRLLPRILADASQKDPLVIARSSELGEFSSEFSARALVSLVEEICQAENP